MKRSILSNTSKLALQIYRDRFREYYCLAFFNSFWIFVPIYGWAKYSAMMGLLARLSYGEVAGNTESVKKAKKYIKSRTWLFFGAGLMETCVFYLRIIFVTVILRIAIIIWLYIGNFEPLFNTLFWSAASISCFYYYYFVMSRLFLYELPLAVENNLDVTESRKTARKLVKSQIFKLPAIIFSFSCIFVLLSSIVRVINSIINSGFNLELITNLFDFSYLKMFGFFTEILFFCGTLFIPALSSAISILFRVVFSQLSSPNSDFLSILPQLGTLVILQITAGALFIPLWQSLKAVTYYQLNLASEKLEVRLTG